MDWPEGKDFGVSPEEEVTRAEEAPLYNRCQKLRNSMPCSWMGPVAFWGCSGGAKLLYGALHNKSRKLPKEKVIPANLQR